MDYLRSIAIAIPTFGRERVLIETLEDLLALCPTPNEILVVDQTPVHEPAASKRLDELQQSDRIRLLCQKPSIPCAMNRALRESASEIVLFLDDDIIPSSDLLSAHQ